MQDLFDKAFPSIKSIRKIKKSDFFNIFDSGKPFGEPCYIDSLKDNLKIVPGYLYCFSGYPGSGKSEFVNFLCLKQAELTGRRTIFYSPENYPVQDMFETMVQSHLGKWIYKGEYQCSREDAQKGYDFVSNNFDFLEYSDIPRIHEILDEWRIRADSKQNQIFVIDPFNSIAEGGMGDNNIAKYLREALTQIKIFAYQTKSIVFLVEHPRSPGGFDSPEVTPYSLFGGSMWFNKSDIITILTRLEDNNVQVKVWKVKNQKLNGKPNAGDPAILKFNWKTNRYEDQTSDLMDKVSGNGKAKKGTILT